MENINETDTVGLDLLEATESISETDTIGLELLEATESISETDTGGLELVESMESINETRPKRGTIFIEARIRDDIDLKVEELEWARIELVEQLSAPSRTFDLGQDILAVQRRARIILGSTYKRMASMFVSLKVVEYSGPKADTDTTCYSTDDARVKVHTYKLYGTGEELESLQQAEVTPLPHVKFDGRWDELVFEDDLKGELIRLMSNILWFSQKSGRRPELNPLILLHGPPGTGKTTLSQGLAQKVSIRLNQFYKQAKLVEIKAATILSKFYSQSAKQIDEIFSAIERICVKDPRQFVCVLIDEVESIASPRESTLHGEVQDSLRATNALLTGLDRARNHPNVVFLCTSNMLGCLDAAFLDRCGLKLAVNPPSLATQYEIIRGRMEHLINDGHIISRVQIPSYRDAELELNIDKWLPGSRLLTIVNLINSETSHLPEEGASGRTISQLPGKALLRYVEEDDCELEMAFDYMVKSIEDERRQAIRKTSTPSASYPNPTTESLEGASPRGQKRDITSMSEEDLRINRALAILDVLEELSDLMYPGWRTW